MEIFSVEGISFLLRWFHFMAGIAWIGILYYFNFIQTPFFASELGGGAKSAMTRGLVPEALWWFRWGAMVTFVTGVLLLLMQLGHNRVPLSSGYATRILTGGLLGTLMWANVWFVIWPAQKIVIASAEAVAGGGDANPAATRAGGKAGMASRTNTVFSVPMLFFMAAAAHFPSLTQGLDTGGGSLATYWMIALGVTLAVEINGLIGPGAPTQKLLTTVSGTVHGGLALALVLFLLQSVLL